MRRVAAGGDGRGAQLEAAWAVRNGRLGRCGWWWSLESGAGVLAES